LSPDLASLIEAQRGKAEGLATAGHEILANFAADQCSGAF
jgi:hypothetical protein